MSRLSFVLLACAVCTLSSTSLYGQGRSPDRPRPPGVGWGPGGKPGASYSVPGPVAGVGLPVAAVLGGYLWIRRRNRQQK